MRKKETKVLIAFKFKCLFLIEYDSLLIRFSYFCIKSDSMITELDFENLISRPESTILDFKREQYKIINDESGIKTAGFVKDIISFANTIRTETAYVIIGISTDNDNKELIGIDFNIDDATFQEKIKDKVYPKPNFLYYSINYKSKKFGIIEIPVSKYSEPIAPIVKMKGLEVGKIYFRRGSSNAEAIGKEVILIDKWLDSLPSVVESLSLNDEISSLLSNLTSNRYQLSNILSDTLRVAKKHSLKSLIDFCLGELSGWDRPENEESYNFLSYRMQPTLIAPGVVQLNNNSIYSSSQIYSQLKNSDGVYERSILFTPSINYLENLVAQYKTKNDALATYNTTMDKLFGDGTMSDFPITAVATTDSFDNIYSRIRQKLIDILLTV